MNAPDPRHPHRQGFAATESEQLLIGQFLADPELIKRFNGSLDPRWFASSRCRQVFEAVKAFTDEGLPLDHVLLAEALRRQGLDIDAQQLLAVVDCVGTTATADEHVVRIREAYERRELRSRLHDACDQLAEPGSVPDEVLADLQLRLGDIPASAPSRAAEVSYFGDPALEPDLTPPAAHIGGLLFEGYTCLSGPPKQSRKTFFTLAQSFALQSGIPFLGRPSRRARVGWLQRDMSQRAFHDYTRLVQDGMAVGPTAIPYISCPLDLMQPESQRVVEWFCEQERIEVLFLDSARALSSARESESDDVRVIVRDFICTRLRDRLGVSVVLICHTPKSGTGARGSGEWEAGADSIVRFEPLGTTTERQVRVTGEGRHPPYQLTFQLDDLGEDGLRIVESQMQDERHESRFQLHVNALREIVCEAAGGVSRGDLFGRLRDRGFKFSSHDRSTLLSTLCREHPEIQEERGVKNAKVLVWHGRHSRSVSERQHDQECT